MAEQLAVAVSEVQNVVVWGDAASDGQVRLVAVSLLSGKHCCRPYIHSQAFTVTAVWGDGEREPD